MGSRLLFYPVPAPFYANVVTAELFGLHFLLMAPLLVAADGPAWALGLLVSDAKPRAGCAASLRPTRG
jgi:hypothetical protein